MKISANLIALARRVEAQTIAIIAVAAAALWAFVALAAEMLEGDLRSFDETVLLALRTPGDPSDPIGSQQVEIAMRDLTALGGVTVLTIVSLAVFGILMLKRQRRTAWFLIIAVLGGQLLSNIAKLGFSRPRPDLVPHGVEVVSASFPSGHSMMAAVTYLTLAVMLAQGEVRVRARVFYLILAALLAVLVGVSRVYLGVHWPTDVLAGWTLGSFWAIGVYLAARYLGDHGHIERES